MTEEMLAKIFDHHDKRMSESQFSEIVQREQEGYLSEMEKPPGTAANSALLENVFVTVVCILNKIPVFIVGKPGIGKGRGGIMVNFLFRVQQIAFYATYQ